MPFADFSLFSEMIDAAFSGGYAYPAVNVHDVFTLNAVVEGFQRAKSDGIVQIYPDAALAVSGPAFDPVLGAVSLAEHACRIAGRAGVRIAIHSDHCSKEQAAGFLEPLIAETEARRRRGEVNLFTSHMFDGSTLPLEENLRLSKTYLHRCAASELWLEIEVGVVGAESADSGQAEANRMYTNDEDFLRIREALGNTGRFLVAPAFGNVHGVYKPGEVALDPSILASCQTALQAKYGARFPLVFHGGSGSSVEEIREVVSNGAVKMNIDTDGQYVFSCAVGEYFYSNLRKVFRIDGEVGVKSSYFAETWLAHGGTALRDYVAGMCETLGSAGKTLG